MATWWLAGPTLCAASQLLLTTEQSVRGFPASKY